MSGNEWVVVIAAISGMLTAVIAAIFSGIVALKQLPAAKRERIETNAEVKAIREDTAEVRRTANGVNERMQEQLGSLTTKLDAATADALAASRAREMPMPDAANPMPVVVQDEPIRVVITEER